VEYRTAEPLFERALAIDKKALGPEHPNLAADLNNLASLYRKIGHDAEAEPLYRRALTILKKVLPADHPDLAGVRANYAGLLDQLGRGAETAVLRAQAAPPGPHEAGGTK
jgi:tetratricopeptide (TPR) repeat protein